MMRDEYRWTDHVISPRRLRIEFIATLLILAILGGASLGGASLADGPPGQDRPGSVAAGAVSTERTPSLATLAKPRFQPRDKKAPQGLASLDRC
jgi:hypothetical protein